MVLRESLVGRVVTLITVSIGLSVVGPAGSQAQPMQVGYADGLFNSADPAVSSLWAHKAAVAGASLARVNVIWSAVAPKRPRPSFVGSNPASPGYEWQGVDNAVRAAHEQGLALMLTVYNAPSWAEGANKPADTRAGTWRPQRSLLREFATALARRYDGAYPDPLRPGETLPRVQSYEVWNEPNQDFFLSPQWDAGKLVGPGIYRNLVNTFYGAVKAVDSRTKIVAGSMSPFGDPPGGSRTPPVTFLRSMLCIRGRGKQSAPCKHPAHFDVLADHPITFGPPNESARSPLDVCPPNLGRLTQILRTAEQRGQVLPRRKKPLWATEFWYITNPPVTGGVSPILQARWYQQALYEVWRGGASAFVVYPLRDPSTNATDNLAAGVYFTDGSPKPSVKAMQFPFVAHRGGGTRLRLWGISPHRGPVQIQVLRKGHWKRFATVASRGKPFPFTTRISLRHGGKLRATMGSQTSLPWTQR